MVDEYAREALLFLNIANRDRATMTTPTREEIERLATRVRIEAEYAESAKGGWRDEAASRLRKASDMLLALADERDAEPTKKGLSEACKKLTERVSSLEVLRDALRMQLDTRPTAADVAAANYKAKELERENDALRKERDELEKRANDYWGELECLAYGKTVPAQRLEAAEKERDEARKERRKCEQLLAIMHAERDAAIEEAEGVRKAISERAAALAQVAALTAERDANRNAYEKVKQSQHVAEDRSQKAEDRVTALEDAVEAGLRLKGGWREAIVELEDHCSEPVRLKNMLAAADQLDDWAAQARAALAAPEGEKGE